MPATVPRSLKLGARTYTIRLDADLLNREATLLSDCPDGLYGHTDNVKMQVTLDPTNPDVRQRETLLHEILHVVIDFAGLSDTLKEAEEEAATRLAPLLLEILTRNPNISRYLLQTG